MISGMLKVAKIHGYMINKMNSKPKKYNTIPKEMIDEAISKVSIVDIISEKVALSQSSRNQWKGLCPFHNEKTPSFFVNDEKNFYHCFGCGESGNIISFLMKIDGLNFRDAVIKVFYLAGIDYFDGAEIEYNEIKTETNKFKKFIEKSNIQEENNIEEIYEIMFNISITLRDILINNPQLFEEFEKINKAIDENYRFKNFERIYDINKNIVKIISEIKNGKANQNERD